MYVSSCCNSPISTKKGLYLVCSWCESPLNGRDKFMYESNIGKALTLVSRQEQLVIDLLKVVRDMIKPLLPKNRADAVEEEAKKLVMGLIRNVTTQLALEIVRPEIKKQIMGLADTEEYEIISPKPEVARYSTK